MSINLPNSKSTITFVTSFIDIYETTFEDKTVDWRFAKFRDIAETGIPICIYVSHECFGQMQDFAIDYPNIRIMKTFAISETWVANVMNDIENENGEENGIDKENQPKWFLPDWRNHPKDIPEYMMLINSKAEFMYDAVQQNPWNTTHFAWIDFSISYVFHHKLATQEYLRILSKRTMSKKPFLVIPGCWNALPRGEVSQITDHVYWRFCGGFLLGDAGSIVDLYRMYQSHFGTFVRTYRKLVWEVNFWAWLEANTEWSPTWYKADHNDCIVHVPVDICCRSLESVMTTKVQYDYPVIDTYEPMQASYVCFRGRHFLNTRYVNYWYWDSGHCHIKHPEDFIISKNLVAELDQDTLLPISSFCEMDDATVCLPSHRCYFYGLEDIRLFVHNDRIRFIATNINYSPTGSNRMIVGEYHPDKAEYSDCRLIEPPYESWCEKNWIPIVKGKGTEGQGKGTEGQGTDQALHFIYKWSPMEIGQVNPETNQLEITHRYPIHAPEFHRVRGSTPFIEMNDYLVGIVHFSESTLPRRYYHILVALDKETWEPKKYSETFSYLHIGIEFCIGFSVKEETNEYICWISKWDREPMKVSIPIDQIPLCYSF